MQDPRMVALVLHVSWPLMHKSPSRSILRPVRALFCAYRTMNSKSLLMLNLIVHTTEIWRAHCASFGAMNLDSGSIFADVGRDKELSLCGEMA